MNTSVRTIAMITLSLVIIAGISLLLYSEFGNTGSQMEDTANNTGDGINCVLDNKYDTEECRDGLTEESSSEVERSDELQI